MPCEEECTPIRRAYLDSLVRCFDVKRDGTPCAVSVCAKEGAAHVQGGRQVDMFWHLANGVCVAYRAVENQSRFFAFCEDKIQLAYGRALRPVRFGVFYGALNLCNPTLFYFCAEQGIQDLRIGLGSGPIAAAMQQRDVIRSVAREVRLTLRPLKARCDAVEYPCEDPLLRESGAGSHLGPAMPRPACPEELAERAGRMLWPRNADWCSLDAKVRGRSAPDGTDDGLQWDAMALPVPLVG